MSDDVAAAIRQFAHLYDERTEFKKHRFYAKQAERSSALALKALAERATKIAATSTAIAASLATLASASAPNNKI